MEYLDKNEIVVEHEGVGYSIDYLERMYGTKYYFWLQKFTVFLFVSILFLGVFFTIQIYPVTQANAQSFYSLSIFLVIVGLPTILGSFPFVIKHGVRYLVFRNNENYKKGKGHIKLYNKLASKMPEKTRMEVERSGKKRMLEPQNRQYLHQLYNGYA